MKVNLKESDSSRHLCLMCRDEFFEDDRKRTCGNCKAVYHAECVEEFEDRSCRTLGCGAPIRPGATRVGFRKRPPAPLPRKPGRVRVSSGPEFEGPRAEDVFVGILGIFIGIMIPVIMASYAGGRISFDEMVQSSYILIVSSIFFAIAVGFHASQKTRPGG